MATLLSAWLANSLWSFTSEFPNAYVTLAVTLVVGILSNATMAGVVGMMALFGLVSLVGYLRQK